MAGSGGGNGRRTQSDVQFELGAAEGYYEALEDALDEAGNSTRRIVSVVAAEGQGVEDGEEEAAFHSSPSISHYHHCQQQHSARKKDIVYKSLRRSSARKQK